MGGHSVEKGNMSSKRVPSVDVRSSEYHDLSVAELRHQVTGAMSWKSHGESRSSFPDGRNDGASYGQACGAKERGQGAIDSGLVSVRADPKTINCRLLFASRTSFFGERGSS